MTCFGKTFGFFVNFTAIASIFFLLPACSSGNKPEKKNRIVEIREQNGAYQLYRNGHPFFIKGAGGYENFDLLKSCGGNSIRIWTSDSAAYVLDKAQKLGLTVTLGLNVAPNRKNFNYSDEKAVEKQLQEIKEVVLKYKDHPALLMWGVGNEVALNSTSILGNIRIWNAVNDIAEMIHEVDPDHPTTTMLAGYPEKTIFFIKHFCPAIDLISINTFGNLPDIGSKVKEAGWDKAFVVTEWGPTGYWEAKRTDWDISIEETSSFKANLYLERYNNSIAKATGTCLGSYVFFWGAKQERTHTWFSLFPPVGERTNMLDALQYLWTGEWPQNKAPEIEPIRLNEKEANQSVLVKVGSLTKASVQVVDPEGDSLTYQWELYPEATGIGLKEGGDGEKILTAIPIAFQGDSLRKEITFKAPSYSGAYRLHMYVLDSKKNVATANIPFYVLP